MRYLVCLAALLLFESAVRAGELDAEYKAKSEKGVPAAAAIKAKASELDQESPAQSCRRWCGGGWGCGWGGWGYSVGFGIRSWPCYGSYAWYPSFATAYYYPSVVSYYPSFYYPSYYISYPSWGYPRWGYSCW